MKHSSKADIYIPQDRNSKQRLDVLNLISSIREKEKEPAGREVWGGEKYQRLCYLISPCRVQIYSNATYIWRCCRKQVRFHPCEKVSFFLTGYENEDFSPAMASLRGKVLCWIYSTCPVKLDGSYLLPLLTHTWRVLSVCAAPERGCVRCELTDSYVTPESRRSNFVFSSSSSTSGRFTMATSRYAEVMHNLLDLMPDESN